MLIIDLNFSDHLKTTTPGPNSGKTKPQMRRRSSGGRIGNSVNSSRMIGLGVFRGR